MRRKTNGHIRSRDERTQAQVRSHGGNPTPVFLLLEELWKVRGVWLKDFDASVAA
jgi:hypothetical protein